MTKCPLPFSQDTSQLTSVTLTSAAISADLSSPSAPWVESCSCPPGFAGQFCEQCAPGFTRQDPNGGPLSPCTPCDCHQHGTCHQETGIIWSSACHVTIFTKSARCERPTDKRIRPLNSTCYGCTFIVLFIMVHSEGSRPEAEQTCGTWTLCNKPMWLEKKGEGLNIWESVRGAAGVWTNLKIELSTKPEVFFMVALEQQRDQKGCSNKTFLCVFPEVTFTHCHFEGM